MISKSLIQLTKSRWREFRREPSAFWFVFLMPVIWMLLLGFIFDGESKRETRIGVETNAMEKYFPKDESFKLRVGDKQSLYQFYGKGDVSVLLLETDTGLDLVFDRNNPESREASLIVQNAVEQKLGRQNIAQISFVPTTPRGSRYIDFLIPGLLALSIMTTSLFGTSMVLVANRRENILKRYAVTPMRTSEFILSHIIGRMIVLAGEVGVILVFGYMVFGFRIEGSVTMFLVTAVLGAGCFTAMAILCGARGNNTGAVTGITNLIVVFLMLVSGIWFGRSAFPDWLIHMTDVSPLVAIVDPLRLLASGGLGEGDLGRVYWAWGHLIAFTGLFSVAAKKLFRWY